MKATVAFMLLALSLDGSLAVSVTQALVESGPVEKYVGCERERVGFKCSDKMAPEIHSAIWFRQGGAKCPPESERMDCSSDVTEIIRAKCNLKKCALIPNKRQLGEPCPGTETLLIKVEYTCRPMPDETTTEQPTTTTEQPTTTTEQPTTTTESPTTVTIAATTTTSGGEDRMTDFGCERQRIAFRCPDKMAPDIHSAIWGRQIGANCPPSSDMMYCTSDVTQIVQEKCGMKKCALIPNKRQLGEPCGGIATLILKVEYSCRPMPTDEPTEPPTPSPYVEGQVRLIDGDNEHEGIAQIFINGQWGNICDVRLNYLDWPDVLCRQMGYPGVEDAVYAQCRDTTYVGSYPIAIHSPDCNALTADAILECPQDPNPLCSNSKDVYVTCNSPTEGLVRLIDGPSISKGYAQIYMNGTWGNICDTIFRETGWPSVICYELGYYGSEFSRYAKEINPDYESSYPINFQSPACTAKKFFTMFECNQDEDYACGHDLDVYVECNKIPRADGDVRLVSGQGPDEGVAQFFIDRRWGTICDRKGDSASWHTVFCKDLGYDDVDEVKYAIDVLPDYEGTPGPYTFKSPACDPTATTLLECGKDKKSNCDYDMDIYIKCKRLSNDGDDDDDGGDDDDEYDDDGGGDDEYVGDDVDDESNTGSSNDDNSISKSSNDDDNDSNTRSSNDDDEHHSKSTSSKSTSSESTSSKSTSSNDDS